MVLQLLFVLLDLTFKLVDQAIHRRLTLRLLEKLECSVETAESGPDVVARASKEDFDVVLMDSQSPGLDGIDVAKRVRSAEAASRTGRPPVVLIGLAATSQAAERERCLAAGMDGYLEYPLTLQTLREMLCLARDTRRNANHRDPSGR